MQIDKLYLQHFRNYGSRLFNFKSGINVLVGKNAVGKTNILEAIFLLATGESFRADKIDEMVGWGQEVAHISCLTQRSNVKGQTEKTQLKAVLTRGMVGGEKARKRRYLVNGVGRQKQTFIGNMVAVAFLPADLELITGSPSYRRRYLDVVLTQVDKEYARSLNSYEKGLRRRNKLLDMIREGTTQRSTLSYWNHLLIKEGNILTDKRMALIDYINRKEDSLRLVYDFSAISEARLAEYERQEVLVGYTMVGPHKDDFAVEARITDKESGYKDLAVYGSRGEQRMGVLWLKMREVEYVEYKLGERPVLLLDDIFSELDREHEELVWQLARSQQTIITTTDEVTMPENGNNLIELE